MPRRNSFAGMVRDWESLLAVLELTSEHMPALGSERWDLEEGLTEELRAVLIHGTALAIAICSLAGGTNGDRNETLAMLETVSVRLRSQPPMAPKPPVDVRWLSGVSGF